MNNNCHFFLVQVDRNQKVSYTEVIQQQQNKSLDANADSTSMELFKKVQWRMFTLNFHLHPKNLFYRGGLNGLKKKISYQSFIQII